ncbi:MAG: hypothetical protein ACR2LV_03005 [Solirubrobacteraceae bacterium]
MIRRPSAAAAAARLAAGLGLLGVLLLIGGCGGSAGVTARSPATAPAPGSAAGRMAPSASRASPPSPSGGVGGGGESAPPPGTSHGSPTGGATGVRLPARFVIGAGGALTPPSVTAPVHLAVDLTIRSGDGERHRVLLRTPAVQVLMVPARGSMSVRLSGLPVGRYELEVDGMARGALVIGGGPGP